MKIYSTCVGLFSLFCIVALSSLNCNADPQQTYVFEAEALSENRAISDYLNKGYGFGQPENEVGGWVTLKTKRYVNDAFVLEEPRTLKLPERAMTAGTYRLALRVVRWVIGSGELATPQINIGINDQTYGHQFQINDGDLAVTGGIYRGAARWQWIAVPHDIEVADKPLNITLALTEGGYNYMGVLVDAIRFTRAGAAVPQTTANAWSGDVAGTNSPANLPGATSLSLVVGDGGHPAQAQCVIRPAKTPDYLVGWLRCELPLEKANIRLSDGRNSVELALTQLMKAQPLALGRWYMILLPKSDPALQKLDRKKNWQLSVTAPPKFGEVRLQLSAWRWENATVVNGWKADNYESPSADAGALTAAESVNLDIQQELAVSKIMRGLPVKAVEYNKKVILWPHARLPGGTPDLEFLRLHGARLKRAGVNGIIFAPFIKKKDETLIVGDEIFSAQSIGQDEFRAIADEMATVDWKGLESSFMRINVVDGMKHRSTGIDWFDDNAWSVTLDKVRTQTKILKSAGLAGIFLDNEEYSPNTLTQYGQQKYASTRSFEEYAAQAFERGKQFAQACRDEYPGMTLMLTYTPAQFSSLRGSPVFSQAYTGSLLPAFVDGLLQVDGITVVDGFEKSYGYRTPRDFALGAWQMEDAARYSRDPQRYRQKMKKAFALWADYNLKWETEDETRNHLSPVNMENALHWALRNSDGYVWLYTESLDWFRGIVKGDHVPSAQYDKAFVDSRAPHSQNWLPQIGTP
jgi:hypothetical protein